MEINTLGLLAMLLVTPPAAMLSDRIGRTPLLYGVAIGGLVLGWPLWWLMHQDAFVLIMAGQIGLALIFGVTFAVVPAVITEHLRSQIRCSGASVSYNFCLGLFGGTTRPWSRPIWSPAPPMTSRRSITSWPWRSCSSSRCWV